MKIDGINGVPEYVLHDNYYIVYRIHDGEKWFFGAYDNQIKACDVAYNVGGKVYYSRKVVK